MYLFIRYFKCTYFSFRRILEKKNIIDVGELKVDLDNFSVIKKGEVLGLAGLLGSGRSEVARVIFGIDKADSGVIKVKDIKNQYTRGRITIQRATVTDDSGEIDIIWFNQPYLTKAIKTNDDISLSGKVELKKRGLQITSPDYEIEANNFNAIFCIGNSLVHLDNESEIEDVLKKIYNTP